MDQESNQMEQHPVLCRNGCGFYSNHGTDGLCSVCYKDMIKKKLPAGPPSMTPVAPGSAATMASLSIDESSSSSSSSSSPAKTSVDTALPTVILPSSLTDKRNEIEGMAIANVLGDNDKNISASPSSSTECDSEGHKEGGKKKKNRCLSCKKKVGLTGFDCRCGGLFCSIHRYSDKHECTFDYKELGAEEIRKSNPVVVASKVQKI